MSFINFPSPTPIFPTLPTQAWSVFKTPSFQASATVAVSGRNCQLIKTVFPRWKFTLTFGGDSWLRDQTQNILIDQALAGRFELELVSGLFLSCLGSYGEFYYSDPDDSSRFQVGLGVGDGSTLDFPVYYTWGTGPYSPAFFAPVGGIQSIDAVYLNGVIQTPTTYHMDTTNTILSFNPGFAPPNNAQVTVDHHFYFRCRFLEDMQEYEQWAKNLWEYKTCNFITVKP